MIAIVDDDESVRTAVSSLVRSLSHAACSFTSAEEFLGSPQLADVACLIVDQQMPGMNGVELQEQLRSAGRRLPIIFITGHSNDRIRERALAGGAICFLSKPFAAQELVERIDQALQASDPVR